MKPRIYTSDGIILARNNYGESDRILLMYSRDQGKVSLIAKGTRKPKSRKRGHIEVFNYIKYQAVKTNGMDLVTEAEIIKSYPIIRLNLKKVTLAYYFCEVIKKITHEGEPNPILLNILVDKLDTLESASKLKELRLSFVYQILSELGYWPKDKKMEDHDRILEEIIEKNISSVRVGKRMLR